MRENLEKYIESSKENQQVYKPLYYKLASKEDKLRLEKLLQKHPQILIFDEILGQVEEFIKCKNPKKVYKKGELTEAAKDFLGTGLWEEYGVWVYYPWSNRLVHLLDEAAFVEVRTNRNQYKITPEEKEILSRKKVGVIGLSVGQSIAVTMAMERSFGELRLADFDILELSNLNRIRTGTHNLGILKVVSVAREIAEIDPFLNIFCFTEGLTEENMDKFFLEGGKLDLLVEACDGLDIKIQSRRKAKALRIPVIMDTSDRGMLDVERYDLEPERPILHGLIDHLDASKLKGLTNEEKVPFILSMVGVDTISTRLKASMLEVEQTITTWPQLASAVTLGGGITADVSRRILLDLFHDSGRYYMDVEEIICDKEKPTEVEMPLKLNASLSDEEMLRLIKEHGSQKLENQIDLDETIVQELVKAGTMAPSGANSQSWKWMYHNSAIYLFLDGIYNAALLDYGNTTSMVSLGAATENLVLKAHSLGLEVIIETPTLTFDSVLIAVFKFFKETNLSSLKEQIEPHICNELVDAIPYRLTNRNISIRHILEKESLNNLRKVVQTMHGADLKIIDEERDLARVAEIIAKMDRIRIMHQGGQQDLRAEIRWSKEEVELTKNGIDLLGTVDITPSELAGFRLVKEWPVLKHLNDWKVGTGLEKIGRKSIKTASAVALVTMPYFNSKNFFIGGRVIERLWLAANKSNICLHPASIAVLMFNTYNYGNKEIFSSAMKEEIEQLRKEFERLFSINNPIGEILLVRLFIAGPPKSRSVRYPIEQVLSFA